MSTADPFAWHPHLAALVTVPAFALTVVLAHRRLGAITVHRISWTRRQITVFCGACVVALAATAWPLGDLAAHWSLAALVVQRLALVLAVAPMLLVGLPYDVIQWASRPRWIDAALTRLGRPLVAIATVTVVLVGSMAPALVAAQASSAAIRAVFVVLTVVAGLVLWIPVIGRVPGIRRPKPVVRFGYLVGQAVVPAFLSVIYIFSTRPLYPTFAGSKQAIGLRPLVDQQIAGFVSKLTMLLVLLGIGAVVLARASRSEDEGEADEPLVWADVERELERAERHDARHGTGHQGPLHSSGGSEPRV